MKIYVHVWNVSYRMLLNGTELWQMVLDGTNGAEWCQMVLVDTEWY